MTEVASVTPYYDRDGITVYNADWRDVLPTLDAVDHVITDPPYEESAHTPVRRVRDEDGTQYAPLDFAPISDSERREVGREMARLSRGWILVFCQVEAAML